MKLTYARIGVRDGNFSLWHALPWSRSVKGWDLWPWYSSRPPLFWYCIHLLQAPMFPSYIEAFNSNLADVVQFTGVAILVLGFSNFIWYHFLPMR